MKKKYIGFAGLSLLLALGTQQVQAQQGFGTDKPHKTAAVDIQSSQRGLLIPRVKLEKTTNGTKPINTPAQSLMVYNEATKEDVTPGYYYWDTNRWVRFAHQSEITAISTLSGDVTGSTNATVVSAIQGKPVVANNPTANQVLTFVPAKDGKEAHWAPVSITEDIVTSSKGITSSTITVGGESNGVGSTLKNVTLNITPGTAGQVLVTNADGTSTTWVNQSVISPSTTNVLTKKTVENSTNPNILVSTVNNIAGEIKLIDNVTNAIDGTSIITSVNGQPSAALDLKGAIQAGQKTTSVINGSDKVSVVKTGAGTTGNNTEYTVDVLEANLNLANIGGTLPTSKLANGTNGQVLITKEGVSTWVDQSSIVPTTTNSLTKTEDNKLVSTVNGVSSAAVDLPAIIRAEQKNVTVVNGTNTTVTETPNSNGRDVSYAVNVSKGAIQAAQKTTVVAAGTGVTVTPNTAEQVTTYTVSANPSAIALTGDVTGNAGATKVGAIQGTTVNPITPTEGQTLVYNNTTKQWVPGTPNVGVANITDKKNLTAADGNSATIEVASGGTNAVLVETSLRIKNGSITPDHLKNGGNNQVLTTNAQGKPSWVDQSTLGTVITANNGLTKTANNIQLGGDLEKATIITATNTKTLAIKGLQPAANTDYVVMADSDGVLKQMKAAMPKFFYMPSILLPTNSTQIAALGIQNVTHNAGVYTVDLYANYVAQFGSPKVSSETNQAYKLPVFQASELVFHVTWFDDKVFENVQFDTNKKLIYKVKTGVNVTEASFMNIVFSVK